MRNFVCLSFRVLKLIFYIYFIVFLSFGWTATVLAQEASESANLLLDQPEIPSLRLPFDGVYQISLAFGEKYPESILKEELVGDSLNNHNGIDFEIAEGTSVMAVDDGEVVLAEDGDYGLTVKIAHSWGFSVYGHLKQINIEIGQKVTKREEIALSGSTGISTGPHLHFGIKPINSDSSKFFGFIDPAPYLGLKNDKSQSILGESIEATKSSVLNDQDKEATPSALVASDKSKDELALQIVENIATDSGYLFNYKFNLDKGTTAHFYDKATKTPSFAIADENYDYKLRFFLNQDASESAQPQVDGNKVEFPVKVGGIPMTLRYTISGDKVKEEFIIDEKPSEEILNKDENLNISFAISSEGLSMERVQEGYEFKSSDGTIVWRISNATIEDSGGKQGSAEDIHLNIEDSKAVLGVKTDFLKNAQYPVVIDPTWTQTDWSGGSGQTSWSDATKFDSSSSVTTSTSGQATLTPASSWFNTSWKYRRKITLNNTDAVLGVTATTLTNFPLLVKLTSSNFDFSKAQSAGEDLRFTDSDGTTSLSYQIESWSTSTSTAFVWVKVPSIDTTGSDSIYAYYGNSSATDAQAATSVWDSSYLGVWHLKESGSGSGAFKDSTSNAKNATGGAGTPTKAPTLTSSGAINGGQTFGDGDDYIETPGITYTNDITVSAWVKGGTQTPSDWNYWVRAGTLSVEFGTFAGVSGNGSGTFKDNVASGTPAVSGTIVTDNAWHYVVGVISSTNMRFYQNGVLRNTNTGYPGGQSHASQAFQFGGDGATRGWNGTIDEIRISNTARSTAWIAAENFSQTASDTFNSFGSEEPQIATSGTLTSSIFDTSRGDWGTLSYTATTPSNTTVSVKARSSNSSSMSGATDFSSCTAISSGAALSTGGCVTNSDRYIQYQITLTNSDAVSTPTFQDVSITYTKTVPVAPSSLSGSAASTSSITWSWTDNSSDEDGFYVQDTSGNTKCTVSSASTTTCTETGLVPGTSYTRNVVAYNSGGNSSASSNASATTRDLPTPSLISPADSAYINTERPVFKFQTPTDNSSTKKYSDVSTYKLTISNADSSYITISNIPASRTTDYDGGTYIASYEGFNDSDITNNYITIYTKTSASWSSASNDGKLKSGKNTWYVVSVDAGGNESAVSRILYADFEKPVLAAISSSDKLGEKDGYLILTNNIPTITAEVTDNLSLDKIELTFSKENYVLGVLVSTEVLFTQTYNLTSSDNHVSYLLNQIVSQALELGSYSVGLKAYDEAGNESQASAVKIKVLTAEQAQQLLQGKISEDNKTTTVSLADLEKKAKLRREKEAAELQKFIESIRTQLSFIFEQTDDVVLNQLASLQLGMESISSQVVILASSVVSNGEIIATSVYSGVLSASSTIAGNVSELGNDALAYLSSVGSTVFTPIHQSAEGLLAGVEGAIVQVPLIGSQISKSVSAIGNGATQVIASVWQFNQMLVVNLTDSEERVAQKVANTQQETNQSITMLSSNINQFLLISEKGTKENFTQANQQTLRMLSQLLGKATDGGNALVGGVNQALEFSQQTTKQRIAQTHKDSSDRVAQASEAIRIALRGMQKPAAQTADLMYRLRVGVDTFHAIVFDEEPTRIADVTIEEIGKDYAVISWKTNHFATGKVNYGHDLSYGEEVVLEKREKYHQARLTNLKPGERVFFEVMSQNKNYAYDAYYSFETLTD